MTESPKPLIPDSYALYVPGILGDHEDELLRQFAWMTRDSPCTVRSFTVFSMMLQFGFTQVTYASHVLESGHLYWITDAHAEMIGRALLPGLSYLGILLTRCEGQGFQIMTAHIEEHVQIDEVLVKHESGDEVTLTEAVGAAQLVTKVGARSFHHWAAEFDPGAIEAFCDTLLVADNRTLCELDICDITKAEPDDRIEVPALAGLLARNRRLAAPR